MVVKRFRLQRCRDHDRNGIVVRARARQDVGIDAALVGLRIDGNGMSARGARLRTMNRLDNAAFPSPVVEGFQRILRLRLWAV